MTTAEQVEGWHREQLYRSGYPQNSQTRLAARLEIDLHQAVDLVAVKRCDLAVAARILR